MTLKCYSVIRKDKLVRSKSTNPLFRICMISHNQLFNQKFHPFTSITISPVLSTKYTKFIRRCSLIIRRSSSWYNRILNSNQDLMREVHNLHNNSKKKDRRELTLRTSFTRSRTHNLIWMKRSWDIKPKRLILTEVRKKGMSLNKLR